MSKEALIGASLGMVATVLIGSGLLASLVWPKTSETEIEVDLQQSVEK
ncbi:MAG: hypothetical protein WKF84_15990 [Pyrinomonadaceae bacterium]